VGANYPKTSAGVRRPELLSSEQPRATLPATLPAWNTPKKQPKMEISATQSPSEHIPHPTSSRAAIFRRPAKGERVKRGYQRVKQGVMGVMLVMGWVFWPTSLDGQDDEGQTRTENGEWRTENRERRT